MKEPRNPFVVGKYVSATYFCDREKETKDLYQYLSNERNVLIISERRLGKSGLIEHCFATTPLNDSHYTFFVDIYASHNLRELVCALANEVFRKIARQKKDFMQWISTFIHSIKTSFTFDALTGFPSFNIQLGEIEHPEITLDEVLDCLEHCDKPCIIAIDEFQQIANFEEKNMEALLRTKVQRLKNVTFVYAGSQSHLLSAMFNSPHRPFYNSVTFMQLGPIDMDVYHQFAAQKFEEAGKHLDRQLTVKIYEHFRGITWYLQLFMNEAFIYTKKGETAGAEMFEELLNHILAVQQFTFEDAYSRFTEKQKMLLVALAQEYPAPMNIMSSEFIKKHHLQSSSSVQSAMKAIQDKGIILGVGPNRQFADLLFADWLKSKM